MLHLKQLGFSDKRIGELSGKKGLDIRKLRQKLGILPSRFSNRYVGRRISCQNQLSIYDL